MIDYGYYCTTFCNQGHSVKTGKPLNHECYILPPKAVVYEEMGEFEKAIETIQAAKPLKAHPGTRCRHVWRMRRFWNRHGWVIDLGEVCSRCNLEKRT